MDEMSEKFFSKFGVKDLGDIIEGGIEEKEFLGRITSCNKVSLLIFSMQSLSSVTKVGNFPFSSVVCLMFLDFVYL